MDEAAARLCKHEAAHASACHWFSWRVLRVSRNPRGPKVDYLMPDDLKDPKLRGEQLAVVLAVPAMLDRWGTEDDMRRVAKLVSAGISLDRVSAVASALVEDCRFIRWRRRVEDALYSRVELDEAAVQELLAGRAGILPPGSPREAVSG